MVDSQRKQFQTAILEPRAYILAQSFQFANNVWIPVIVEDPALLVEGDLRQNHIEEPRPR